MPAEAAMPAGSRARPDAAAPPERARSVSRHRWRAALLPVLVSAALITPNVVVIASGTEDFPFTTAPMFAHYVGPASTLAAFRLVGVRGDATEELPVSETGLNSREVQRQLVSWFYRPQTDTAPFRDLSGASDDPAVFADRMSAFFRPLTDFLRERRSLSYDTVELYADVVDSSGSPLRTELVGSYDVADDRYTQRAGSTP